MNELTEILTTINHSREKRAFFAALVNNQPAHIPQLLVICNRVHDEISYRAAWGLEFLCKEHLETLLPYLNQFFEVAPNVYQHQAVRPMAKILEYLSLGYYKQQHTKIKEALTTQHREKMIEICFDWLITEQKVAAKAYCMTSLHLLGTEFDWVHPELKNILENTYCTGSAAYQARCRMILKKL